MSLDSCVALPHDATGLCAVCDCGIFWSYSLILHVRSARKFSLNVGNLPLKPDVDIF